VDNSTVNGLDLVIEDCYFSCAFSYPNCSFTINLTETSMSMIGSTINFQNIFINATSISIDSDSALDANGTGYTYGLGYSVNMGASFAGQGGSCYSSTSDFTYGTYFMKYNDTVNDGDLEY